MQSSNQTHRPHQLSGVGRWDTFAEECLNAPWERDAIRVDLPQLDYLQEGVNTLEKEIHAANFINSMNEDKEPHGYLIHANCWTCIEQRIGPRAEQHLELFLRVLRIRWQKNPFELSRYVRVDHDVVWVDSENDWDEDEMLEKYGADYLMPEFFGLREDNRMYHRARSMFVAKYMFPVWDPLDIPAVRELFRKGVEACARETVK